jgi:hypothetical protein
MAVAGGIESGGISSDMKRYVVARETYFSSRREKDEVDLQMIG